jgi:hypothetical protein
MRRHSSSAALLQHSSCHPSCHGRKKITRHACFRGYQEEILCKVEGYKELAACRGSYRAYHFCMQQEKEITIDIAGEIQGGRGITLSCIHAGSFHEKKMETNLDMLHPDTNMFPFGTRLCIACPHFPRAKSIYQMIEREIKETIKEGNGYKYILFVWEPGGRRGILRWHLDGEVMLFICRHHEGRAHYRHCPNSELPQLLLWSTTTKEHMHSSSHITVTSGNSVVMWFSLGQCACRASASLPHTQWTPLPS